MTFSSPRLRALARAVSAAIFAIASCSVAAVAAEAGLGARLIAWPDASLAAKLDKIAPAVKVDNSMVGHYGYGIEPTKEQIAGWAIDVWPDGRGLPPGSGSVDHGADVFSQQCAACHGTFGEGVNNFPKLASNNPLTGDQPTKSVGNYWPYATTLFDYINRAMPFPMPHSLSANDVYAITAYILNLNNLAPDNFIADAKSLAAIKMPNRNGFIIGDPRPDTNNTECIKKCVDPAKIKIQSTAEGKDLTPKTTGPLDEMTPH